jgi:hypothetical protein
VFMLKVSRPGPRKDRRKFRPCVRGTHVDDADRLDRTEATWSACESDNAKGTRLRPRRSSRRYHDVRAVSSDQHAQVIVGGSRVAN